MGLPQKPPMEAVETMWPPLSGFDHAGDEGDHAVDDAAEADAHDPVVVLVGGRLGRAERVDARGVEHQLRRAPEDLLDLIGGGRVGGPVGDVELDGVGRCALVAEVGQRLVESILAHVGDDDLAPGLGEHLGLPEARPRSPSGDEQDLVLEVLHV